MLIVRDTRESGEMLEASLAAGVAAGGGHALLGGVLPTPGAALLVRRHGFDLAAVVSASHNPYEDNGIKFFGPDGMKVSDEQEAQIEEMVLARGDALPNPDIGRVRELHGAGGDYLRELELRFRELDLSGTRVLLDCANGATYQVAPEIFRRLGAESEALAVDPGRAEHQRRRAGRPTRTRSRSGSQRAVIDVGFAFDGDGDRVLAVDRTGAVVDGDELLALAALHLREAGRLPGGGVAVTVMTNYGFHTAMRDGGRGGGGHARRRPARAGRARSPRVGAGWRAVRPHHRHRLRALGRRPGVGAAHARGPGRRRPGRPRRRWRSSRSGSSTCPCADRGALEGAAGVHDAIAAESEFLEGRGRVLVRPSGTEPLVRVMVEAPDEAECTAITQRLVQVVERELGA